MKDETLITPAGLEQLRAELDHLINVWRPEIAEKIKSARELGDLKENAEYHAAKDEQGITEARIRRLEERLRTARVVEEFDASAGGMGTTVTVVDADTGEREQFHVTGPVEADPLENRVSTDSPIGRALTGAKVGDTVTVQLPRGEMRLMVEAIELTS